MNQVTIQDAPPFLNLNDQAMWVLGYNEAVEKLKAQPLQAEETEPQCVAKITVHGKRWTLDYLSLPIGTHRLYAQQYSYTALPELQQPALTDEWLLAKWDELKRPLGSGWHPVIEYGQAIQAALRNGGAG